MWYTQYIWEGLEIYEGKKERINVGGGKKRKEEGRREGEKKIWNKRRTCILNATQDSPSLLLSLHSWTSGKAKKWDPWMVMSAPSCSPVDLMKPLMSLMKNSYKNTWFVFIKSAKKQRKMNIGSWLYPEAFLSVILGFLPLYELYPLQEMSYG